MRTFHVYGRLSLLVVAFGLTAAFLQLEHSAVSLEADGAQVSSRDTVEYGWGWTNSAERCSAFSATPPPNWSCYQPFGADSTSNIVDPYYDCSPEPYTCQLGAVNLATFEYRRGYFFHHRAMVHQGELIFSANFSSRYYPESHPEGERICAGFDYQIAGEEEWHQLWSHLELVWQGSPWQVLDLSDRVPEGVPFYVRYWIHDPNNYNLSGRVNLSRFEDYSVQSDTLPGPQNVGKGDMACPPLVDSEVEPNIAPQVPLYPNPTRGLVHLEGEEVVKVQVYDLSGRRVLVREDLAGVRQIDLSGLPAGTYVLRLKTRQGEYANQRVTVVG